MIIKQIEKSLKENTKISVWIQIPNKPWTGKGFRLSQSNLTKSGKLSKKISKEIPNYSNRIIKITINS